MALDYDELGESITLGPGDSVRVVYDATFGDGTKTLEPLGVDAGTDAVRVELSDASGDEYALALGDDGETLIQTERGDGWMSIGEVEAVEVVSEADTETDETGDEIDGETDTEADETEDIEPDEPDEPDEIDSETDTETSGVRGPAYVAWEAVDVKARNYVPGGAETTRGGTVGGFKFLAGYGSGSRSYYVEEKRQFGDFQNVNEYRVAHGRDNDDRLLVATFDGINDNQTEREKKARTFAAVMAEIEITRPSGWLPPSTKPNQGSLREGETGIGPWGDWIDKTNPVPLEVASSGSQILAGWLYAVKDMNRRRIANELGVGERTVSQYLSDLRKRRT
jgi:hypothetical protein